MHRLCCALGVAVSAWGSAAVAQDLPTTPMTFEIIHTPANGREVFVTGDAIELGSGDPRRALKLVQAAGNRWWVTVDLPGGVEVTHRFIERDASDGALLDLTNAFDITADSTLATPDVTPAPLQPGHALIVRTTLSNPLLAWRQDDGAFNSATLDPIDAADTGPVREFVAWGIGDATEQLEFYLFSIAPLGREPASGSAFTSYNATVYAEGQSHAYAPPETWTPQRIDTRAVPTTNVLDTRTIDGITGRGVRVLLPRNYDDRLDATYPVLYMHDGQNVFDPGGPFGSRSVDNHDETQSRLGRIDEAIIVAIDNSSQRNAELAREFSIGGSIYEGYERFVLDDLMPWVNANYRTRTGPAHTGVAGSSLGGLASATLPMDNPGVFGRAGLFSPSFWLGNTQSRVNAGGLDGLRVYLDAGTQSDGLGSTFVTRDALLSRAPSSSLGRELQHAVGLNQGHNEPAWSARTPAFLRFMYPAHEADTLDVLQRARCAYIDTNNDGVLDIFDVLGYLAEFEAGAPGADLDGSDERDIFDVLIMLADFDSGC